MPATRTCCIYLYLPLTLSGMSTRGTRVPTIEYAARDFGAAKSGFVRGCSMPRLLNGGGSYRRGKIFFPHHPPKNEKGGGAVSLVPDAPRPGGRREPGAGMV